MFETVVGAIDDAGIVEPALAGDLSANGLAEVIASTQRLESVLMARRLAAVFALLLKRTAVEDANPMRQFALVDGHEQTCAEISALLNISPTAASYVVGYAAALHHRLPRVATLLASGQTDWRTVKLIIGRTDLVAKDIAVRVDAVLAEKLANWQSWSRQRIINAVDAEVLAADADAAKQRRAKADADRFINIDPYPHGMAEIYGRLSAADGAALNRTLTRMASGVCAADPRRMSQRRADALAALTKGRRLVCRCGQPDCPARQDDNSPTPAAPEFVINVLAGAETINGAGDRPGYLEGYGVIDADQVRQLAATALQRMLDTEVTSIEALRYHPSAALARAVRARDLTCRFPGCSRPASDCDIDHTVAFNHHDPSAGGLTVPSNLKCLCRKHHRLKTFHTGWRDQQCSDGTVIWTSPTGRKYRTAPAGAELFPEISGRRRRTRAHEQALRIARARNRNHVQRRINEAERAAQLRDDPPPF